MLSSLGKALLVQRAFGVEDTRLVDTARGLLEAAVDERHGDNVAESLHAAHLTVDSVSVGVGVRLYRGRGGLAAGDQRLQLVAGLGAVYVPLAPDVDAGDDVDGVGALDAVRVRYGRYAKSLETRLNERDGMRPGALAELVYEVVVDVEYPEPRDGGVCRNRHENVMHQLHKRARRIGVLSGERRGVFYGRLRVVESPELVRQERFGKYLLPEFFPFVWVRDALELALEVGMSGDELRDVL
ncbi:ABC transporter ATP-binding protein/permease [Babesia caballi]|uniref:ABC transporter ATP-binding protein/permease n=1 Tax=Babesia caballi TaxID=5871 RepID=A0AAV4M0Y7_BABCB|nr:ABC transporter ATP-binding protein/permease [Babesia caballi]